MDDDERYVDEFGRPLERYSPKAPDMRGRHKTFGSALDVAFKGLLPPDDPFFDKLASEWNSLFPGSKLSPSRREGDMIFLSAPNSAALFVERPRLTMMKSRLAKLPGAPIKFSLKLEVKR